MRDSPLETHSAFWRFLLILLIAVGAFFARGIFTHGSLSLDGLDRANNLIATELGTQHELRDNRFAYQDTAPWQCLGPADHFAMQEIREGRIPLWSPNVAMGWPVYASGSAAPFSPFKIPLYLFPSPLGMNLYLLLKILASGVFTYFLLRRLRRSPAAATFGALGYAFCGYSISYLPFHHDPVALLPLLLYLGESLLRKPGNMQGINLGLVAAVTLYSGHATVAVMTLIATAFYIVLRRSIGAWTHKGVVRASGIAVILCFLLSAPFTFPMVEFLQNGWSYKTDISQEVDESGAEREMSFGARRFASSAVPHFRQAYRGEERLPGGAGLFQRSPTTGDPIFGSFLYAYMGYFGALTWVLAFFYLGTRPRAPVTRGMNRPRRTLFLFVLPAIFIAFALPGSHFLKYIPIFGDILPRYFLSWLSLAFLITAAHGFDELLQKGDTTRRFTGAVAFYSLMVTIAAALYVGTNTEGATFTHAFLSAVFIPLICAWLAWGLWLLHLRNPFPAKVIGALFCCILWGELFIHGHWIPGAPPYAELDKPRVQEMMGEGFSKEDRVAALGHTLWPNTSIYAGLNDVQGILPLFIRRYRKFMEIAEPSMNELYPTSARVRQPNAVLDLASVSRYLIPAQWAFGSRDPSVVYLGEELRVLSRESTPRAYLASSLTPARDVDVALSQLNLAPELAARSPIVEAQSATSAKALQSLLESGGNTPTITPVEITSYQPTEVSLRIPDGKRGLLVLTDMFYPGWHVELDGKPAEILPVNVAFRGVVIESHTTSVRFYYAPRSLHLGLGFFVIGALFSLLLVFRERTDATA